MEYQDACGTATQAAEFTDFPGKRSLFVVATEVGYSCSTAVVVSCSTAVSGYTHRYLQLSIGGRLTMYCTYGWVAQNSGR